jgi:hypothetical protein
MFRYRVTLLLTGLVLLASRFQIQAQTTATIYETVNDVRGAPVPNARITATNLATNVARKHTTAQDGSYSLTFMPLGTYKVEVDSDGFKKFEQTGIVLDVNRNARVDAILQLHPRERIRLMFRGEMTNAFNLVNLSNPGVGFTSSATFGKVTTASAMRQIQHGLRLTF